MDRVMGRWIARARQRVEVSIDFFAPASDVMRDLWIQWHVPHDGDLDILDVEAMELLELFARLDYESAWFVILRLVGQHALCDLLQREALAHPEARVFPRFVVHNVQHLHAAGTLQRFAHWLTLPIDSADHSPQYKSVRDMLVKSVVSSQRRKMFVRSPEQLIPVKFHVDLMSAGNVLEDLASLAAFAHEQKKTKKHGDLFELTGIIPRWSQGVITDTNLQSLQSFTEHGVQVEHLGLASAVFVERQVSPEVAGGFLRDMLLADDAKNNPATVSLGPNVSVGVFKAACSALPKTQSVEVLHAEPFEKTEDHNQFWTWLAYALFSNEARNSIKRLDLDASKLTNANVDVFELVMKARDPLLYLDKTSTENREREPVVVDVAANATLHATSEVVFTIKTSEPVLSLRVVGDSSDDERVRVMYPGVGICSVDRKHTTKRLPPDATLEPRPTEGIDRLGLDLTDNTSLDALPRLVKLIGPSIKTLGIRCFTSYLFIENSILESLLAVCPNVDRLEMMHLEVTNFAWLPANGLRSLSLDSIETVEPKAYEALMADLASRRILLSQFHMQATEETFEAIEEPMTHLLESTTVLERILVAGNTDDLDQEVPPVLTEELEQHDLAPISVQESPLPLRSKLAFLSGIQPPQVTSTHGRNLRSKRKRHNIPELDAALAELIFQFAAPHKLRVCGVVAFKESW